MPGSKTLVICIKYSTAPDSPYLTNDLVNGVVDDGREVVVLAVGDVSGPESPKPRASRLHEYLVRFGSRMRFAKYLLLWPAAAWRMLQIRRRHPEIDRVIAFAPLLPMWPVIAMTTLFRARKLCIVFDLFPVHQAQIRAVPRRLERILRWPEARLLRRFHCVTGMTPENVRAIRDYYRLPDRPVEVLHLWGARRGSPAPPVADDGGDVIRMVFGGQITFGRDFPLLVDLLADLRAEGLPIEVDVFSAGPAMRIVREQYAEHAGWLRFRDPVARDVYRSRLPSYHVGLVVTAADVNVPTFPSKIVDYLCSGLKVLCLIERRSDVAEVIACDEALHVNHFDRSPEARGRAAAFVRTARERLSPALIDRFAEKFGTTRAVARINALIGT